MRKVCSEYKINPLVLIGCSVPAGWDRYLGCAKPFWFSRSFPGLLRLSDYAQSFSGAFNFSFFRFFLQPLLMLCELLTDIISFFFPPINQSIIYNFLNLYNELKVNRCYFKGGGVYRFCRLLGGKEALRFLCLARWGPFSRGFKSALCL